MVKQATLAFQALERQMERQDFGKSAFKPQKAIISNLATPAFRVPEKDLKGKTKPSLHAFAGYGS